MSGGDDMPMPDPMLDAVLGMAGDLELSHTLRRIVKAAAVMADAAYAALGVLGRDGSIREFVTEGLEQTQVDAIGPPPQGKGILGLLIRNPEPLRLVDLSQHPDAVGFPAHHPTMRSFLGVPITVRGAVFGNLYLTEKRGADSFTERDEQLVVTLAAAAGVAIDNARLYAEVEQRARWLRASSEVAAAALRGDGSDEVARVVETQAREAAGASHASLVGHEVEHDQLDPAHRALHVPVATATRSFGSLQLTFDAGASDQLGDDPVAITTFGEQAAMAIGLAEAQDEQERLALLEERDRIARDLHDLVIQRLFATGMVLQGAQRLTTDEAVLDRIGRAVDDLDETIREVRSTIFALHQNAQGGGLRSQVLQEVSASAATLGFEPTVRFDGPIDSTVSDDVRVHVVAALREALANVARHAAATTVRVSLSVEAAEVVLIVTDNGRGLPADQRHRSGLANLADRAASAQGVLTVEPANDERGEPSGTRVVWRAPVES